MPDRTRWTRRLYLPPVLGEWTEPIVGALGLLIVLYLTRVFAGIF